jgi:hypothetical protein
MGKQSAIAALRAGVNAVIERIEQRVLLSAAVAPTIGSFAPGEFTVMIDAELAENIGQRRDGLAQVAKSIADRAGAKVHVERSSGGADREFLAVSTDSKATTDQVARWARSIPGFMRVDQVFIDELSAIPNDVTNDQWYLNTINHNAATNRVQGWQGQSPNATPGSGVDGVVVAVIDTGLDMTHPDIVNNIWRNPGEVAGNNTDDDGNGLVDDITGWDFVEDDNDPSHLVNTNPEISHGTNVAGVLAASTNNNLGIASVGWDVSVLPLRVGGYFDSQNILRTGANRLWAAEAVNYVVDLKTQRGINVQVINYSAGGSVETPEFKTAINNAQAAGIILVASAGNGALNAQNERVGFDIDSTPVYPASYARRINGVKVNDNVIAVAATDAADRLTSFSNWGDETVTIAAPGFSIRTLERGGGTVLQSGTSFSAPMVAAVMAQMYAARPLAAYTDVISSIEIGADQQVVTAPLAPGNSAAVIANSRRLNFNGTLTHAGAPNTLTRNIAVSGTNASDTITVVPNGANLVVTVTPQGGATTTYNYVASQVQAIAINGVGGDDNISLDSTLLQRAIVNGGTGADTIQTANGRDIIAGSSGNDSILAGTSEDLIFGQSGNDQLFGQGNDDTLVGGLGNDSLSGDSGRDMADYNRILTLPGVPVQSSINATLDSTANDTDGDGGIDNALTEHLIGGSAADTLTGNAGNNIISGGSGNDTIWGQGGSDTVNGNSGSDRFRMEDGVADDINGGNGGGQDYFITIAGADLDVDRISEGDLLNDIWTNMDN